MWIKAKRSSALVLGWWSECPARWTPVPTLRNTSRRKKRNSVTSSHRGRPKVERSHACARTTFYFQSFLRLEDLFELPPVLHREVGQSRFRQRQVDFTDCRNIRDDAQVLAHGCDIAANDRTAEGSCRAKPCVIGQRLLEAGTHSFPCGFSSHSCGGGGVLGGGGKRHQPGRGKRGPAVISHLVLLADGMGAAPHGAHDAACRARGACVPFNCERNVHERWARTEGKGPQRMHRRSTGTALEEGP